MFSVRLVSADYYVGSPIPELDVGYSEFRGAEVKQVPVIRIFGSTITGKKACLHVHGVFPYIYIPYEGSGHHDRFMYQMASSLDKALNISLGRANSTTQHVYKVVLVSGFPFYGFHTKEHQYFKIYFYNPLMIRKATDLLQSGAILNKIYQPHEAHVPYILQFMIDYNLYGMNLINLENVKFRRDPENPGSFETLSEEILLPEKVTRISTCELEVDAMAADITNRMSLTDELAVNPGLAAIWEDEMQRRREEGRTSQITPRSSQERPLAGSTDSEIFFKQRLREKLQLLNSQHSDHSSPLLNTPDLTRTPYPAETPKGSDLIDASFLDVHSSGSSSFIRTEEYDASVVNEDMVLSLLSSSQGGATLSPHDSVLLNSQDVELAEILYNLENSVDVDQDSVLGSQIPKEFGNDTAHGSDDEDMQDLSQPLDAADKFNMDDNLQKGNLIRRSTDHEDDSLWENTFWEDVSKNIPQMDGADDVPEVPRRRRFGMRGKAFPRQSSCKSSVTNSSSADTSVQIPGNENMSCNGAAEFKVNVFCLSAGPEKEIVHVDEVKTGDIAEESDDRSAVIAGDLEMQRENDVAVRNSLLELPNDSYGSVTMESTETVPVVTDDSVMYTKSSKVSIIMENMETRTKINPVTFDSSLEVAKDNGPVSVVHLKTVFEICPSAINGLTSNVNEDSNMETESKIYFDDLVFVPEDSVDPVIPKGVRSESVKILSEVLSEVSKDSTVPETVEGTLFDSESNSSIFNGLSEVSEDIDVNDTRFVSSQSAKLGTEQIYNRFSPIHLTEESSNSEINFQPVSVVCCNTFTALCTSDSSTHDLQINGSGGSFEVDGQDCEQFKQSVLIGDPSFTAQSGPLEGDNELQVNALFCNDIASNTWLSSDKNSETSNSSYLSDIDADLLTQYDTQAIQEISPEKTTVPCRTGLNQDSLCHNNSNQKRNLRSCTRLIQSKRMSQNSKSCGFNGLKPNTKIEQPRILRSGVVDHSAETLVTKRVSRCVLPKLSLNIGTEGKDILLPTISALSSCTLKCPMDVSPVEVKRIETLLWEGNIDEIIQLEDDSTNDGLLSQNRVENAREMLESCVHKARTRSKNSRRAPGIAGSKSIKGIDLSVGDRMERPAVSYQTRNILRKLLCQNGNILTKKNMLSPSPDLMSQVCAIRLSDEKCTGQSSGIHLKKLARKLQREKRKKLSLSYRRKSSSLTSEERNKHETISITAGDSTDDSTEMCLTFVGSVECDDKHKIPNKSNRRGESVPNLSSLLQKGLSSQPNSRQPANLSTERRNKYRRNHLENNYCYKNSVKTPLRNQGHFENELKADEDPFIGRTLCGDHDSNKNIVSLTSPRRFRSRPTNFRRQDKSTAHDINFTLSESLDDTQFDKDENGSSLHNLTNRLTSCLNGQKCPDLGKHLSELTNGTRRRRRGVQENNVGQSTSASDIPVGSKGLISNVDVYCKEKAQSECNESLHRSKYQRNVLKKESYCNNSLYLNETCIRPCYVRLVRLEDAAEHMGISPCKAKSSLRSHKVSSVCSHGSKHNLPTLSCKSCENLHKIPSFQHKCMVDHERCKAIRSSNKGTKARSCKIDVQRNNIMFLNSGDRSRDKMMITRSVIEETCISVPVSDENSNSSPFGGTRTKTSGSIKDLGNNVLNVNMTSDQYPTGVACEDSVSSEKVGKCPLHVLTKTENQSDKIGAQCKDIAISRTRGKSNAEVNQESDFNRSSIEIRNKEIYVQEQCDINSVQVEHRKHLRRKVFKDQEHTSKKLSNSVLPDKWNLLCKMKPFSISLEKLDQSILEKHSVTLTKVATRTMSQKSEDFMQQEMASSINPPKSYSDGSWKDIEMLGKLKHMHNHDKIPCLDGAFETSSSDDSTESRNIDCLRQLEKSPLTKKARRQENVVQKVENTFSDLEDSNTDYSDTSALVGTQQREPSFGTPTKNLKRRNIGTSCKTCSPKRSPRRTTYPPLAIKIQKSPKKRTVDNFQGNPSDGIGVSELINDTSVSSNASSSKGEGSRLSGVEINVRKPKHAAGKQNITNVKMQEQHKDMCNIFKKIKKRSFTTSGDNSRSSHSSCPMSTDISVIPSKDGVSSADSSICHQDPGTTEDQRDTSGEKYISSSRAVKGKYLYSEENCQIDILQNCNTISSPEHLKRSEFDNNHSIQSVCSFPVRTETKKDSTSELYACSQNSDRACNENESAVPESDRPEAGSMEQILDKWARLDVRNTLSNKLIRKQANSRFLRNHPKSEPELKAERNDLQNMSEDSNEEHPSRTETSKSNAVVGKEFSERKKISKGRQSLDMFRTEDAISRGTASPRIIATEGSLLCESPTLSESPKTNNDSSNSTQTSDTNLYKRTESVKDSSLDGDSNIVCDRSAEKVQQPTEEEYNSNSEDHDQGILSFYNVTMVHSPTVSDKFQDSLIQSSLQADHCSKHAVDLEHPLFTHTVQNSSDHAAETSVNVTNLSQSIEQLHKKECYFRIIKNDTKNCRLYTPRYNPPSKDEILASLSEFCIPEHRHQEPFVSNVLDITNKKEVGNKVLKICSTSVLDLQPFVGSLLNVADIEALRKKCLHEFSSTSQRSLDLSSMKPALAGHRQVVITPCKLPPNIIEVKQWLETRALLSVHNQQETNVEDKVSSRKIAMPLSPGQESGSDNDMSLSPVTPRSISFGEKNGSSVITAHSTPQVSLTSHHPLSLSCTPIQKTNHKIAKMLLRRSRRGLKLDSPNRENSFSTLPSVREESEEAATDTRMFSSPECAGKDIPTTNSSSKLDPLCGTSETCKLKDSGNRSEYLRAAEPVQPDSTSSLKSSSEVPDDNQPIPRQLLHHQIYNLLTTPRGVKRMNSSCQIEESTPNNTFGFRMSLANLNEVKAICEFLTTFIMEMHIQTRGDLRPDPSYDPIRALFYMVMNDVPDDSGLPKHELGVIMVNSLDGDVKIPLLKGTGENCKITYVENELSLVQELVKCVRKWDPDILGGYEVEMLSWGYLFQRAYTLQVNLGPSVSRVPTSGVNNHHTQTEGTSSNSTEEIKVPGRIVLNIWKLMRHQVALQSYTFENVMYHILHQRIALHSFRHLTHWWEHKSHLYRWICVENYLLRVQGIAKLMDQLDFIGQTSELARLFGIQFLEVLSRGSQFRVESMMLRLAKPLNYVPVSPSIQQRARMRAPESIPLIMEPNSRFYSDPVIVLDFQSLYPSIIIAYNYCFSTCLGRVEHLGQATPFVFGCTQLRVPPAQLIKLKNNINISPCGVAFVKDGIRKGVLPRMLQEILDTRLMVKQSMKEHKSNKTLQRVLHSRQLGLKLIANVTYGYTAANFSGRMPCSEVGDSVVSKARETLERAIHLVEATSRWGAQVVYGDTDSLFVLVPGKSREQAFKIGAEIAEAVTLDNPKPVKLKLEKVYEPCILQTKKRYVGYMYENPDQEKPVYDAKGIETVRRDGCPAVAKILEKSLRLVFETRDVSLVKNYVCRQFTKVLQGRLNIQDLIFAREYRGMSGYRPGACVPALELARRWLQTDRRAEPRQSERVPYIIVNGPPGLPLIRLVRSPHELLADPSLRVNSTYYITRVIIPALDRCFSLLGAEVDSWYADMPRKFITNLPTSVPCGLKKSTISQYFTTVNCVVCYQLTNVGLCLNCQQQPQKVAIVFADKIRLWERTYSNVTKVCQSCCGRPEAIECISLDCPILFRRNQSARDLQQAPFIRSLQDQYLTF